MKKMKCYDICCGAGIFSLGFKQAGFNVLGGIDVDKDAIETASNNIKDGAWENIKIESLSKKVEESINHLPVFKADVILAGLPCQGFSVAGKGEPGDHRNQLYKYLMKILKKARPEFVVIENVSGILLERNKVIFDNILKSLSSLGYDVEYRLFNAANLGVPQQRRRTFIVASQSIPSAFIFEQVNFKEHVSVKSALKGLRKNRENKKRNHTFMLHSNDVKRKIRNIHDASVISYRRLKLDKPAVTIISGHNALPVHPLESRAISNREAARIQGIPDNFFFYGSRTQQTVQIANAVPFPVAFEFGRAIVRAKNNFSSMKSYLYKSLEGSNKKNKNALKKEFVNFYQKNGKAYQWRKIKDPYKILLTELLLQRTRSDMVNSVWLKVISTVKKKSGKYELDKKVLTGAIKKLGIFNRIKTIEKLNNYLAKYYENKVPKFFDGLMKLPGVGIYIAAAVRTFAFSVPDFPVDSNGFRFINRFFGKRVRGTKNEARQIREFMNGIIDKKKPKEFVYGFLDFCSSICTPVNPACEKCKLNTGCYFFHAAQ